MIKKFTVPAFKKWTHQQNNLVLKICFLTEIRVVKKSLKLNPEFNRKNTF